MRRMARPYRDAAELSTTPVDRSVHPLVTEGSVILEGIAFPAVEGPVPIMLVPGYEYRVRQHYFDEDGHDGPSWVMERRAVGG
jgi:hypothetical protein